MNRSYLLGLSAIGVLLTTSPMLIAAPGVVQPAIAQRVVEVTPPSNSTNVSPNTFISGQFDTSGTIDVNSVRISVNGQDVTSQSSITPNFFTYRPAQSLPPGTNQVRVEYRTTNGEQRTLAWAFSVQGQPLQLTSVTTNAGVAPLNTGSTLTVTINGTPGLQASVLLIQDGRTVRELPATETSSGVYRVNYTVQSGDRSSDVAVLGRLRRQTQSVYAALAQPVAFNTAIGTPPGGTPINPPPTGTPSTPAELQPRFVNYQDGGRVGRNGFTLVGQTRPNARVQVNVLGSATVLGVPVGGEVIVDREFTADSNGRFEVTVPPPRIAVPGLRYRIRATAIEGNQVSPTTEIILRQQIDR
jgi:hypothetical protein